MAIDPEVTAVAYGARWFSRDKTKRRPITTPMDVAGGPGRFCRPYVSFSLPPRSAYWARHPRFQREVRDTEWLAARV